jgi:endonuclease/exonuclease/phosphatase family metal-dependent hydrolase
MKIKTILLLSLLSLNVYAGLKLATYNIRNFDYDPRYDIRTNKGHLKKILSEVNADLMAVQEIIQDRVFIQFIEKNFPDYGVVISECGGQNDQKLGFIYNKTRLSLTNVSEDLRLSTSREAQAPKCFVGSRPAIVATFHDKKDNTNFVAMTLHLKSGGHPQSIKKRFYQIDTLASIVRELKSKGHQNFILMGDFNTTEYIQKDQEYTKFLSKFEDLEMQDLSMKVKCTSYWFGGVDDKKQYPSILDHIIVSKFLKNPKVEVAGHCKQTKCAVTQEDQLGISFEEVSDHCPLTATF